MYPYSTKEKEKEKKMYPSRALKPSLETMCRLQQMASWQGERARVLQMKNQRFLFPAEQQRTAEDDPLGKIL
jgi:hypothetical protein